MHTSTPFIALLITICSALPTRQSPQIAHLVLHAATTRTLIPLNVTTDGVPAIVQDGVQIESIDINDFNAHQQCIFKAPDETVLEPKLDINTKTGEQRLVFAPPQAVGSVTCEGTCVPLYGECFDSIGMPVGLCCNGFCAATRCRAWTTGSNV